MSSISVKCDLCGNPATVAIHVGEWRSRCADHAEPGTLVDPITEIHRLRAALARVEAERDAAVARAEAAERECERLKAPRATPGREEQAALDREHLERPQSGDYWHEMLTPVCVVLGRDGGEVILCRETRDVGDGWTWDLRYVERITLTDFAQWLRYKSESLGDRTWCHVKPRAHRRAREEASRTMLGAQGEDDDA